MASGALGRHRWWAPASLLVLCLIWSIVCLSGKVWLHQRNGAITTEVGLWTMCIDAGVGKPACMAMPRGADCSEPDRAPCDSPGGVTCTQCQRLNSTRAFGILAIMPTATLSALFLAVVGYAAAHPESNRFSLPRWKKWSAVFSFLAGGLWLLAGIIFLAYAAEVNSNIPPAAPAFTPGWSCVMAIITGIMLLVTGCVIRRIRDSDPAQVAAINVNGGHPTPVVYPGTAGGAYTQAQVQTQVQPGVNGQQYYLLPAGQPQSHHQQQQFMPQQQQPVMHYGQPLPQQQQPFQPQQHQFVPQQQQPYAPPQPPQQQEGAAMMYPGGVAPPMEGGGYVPPQPQQWQ